MVCVVWGVPEGRNVGRRASMQRGRKEGRSEGTERKEGRREGGKEGRKEGRKEGMKLLAVGDVEIDWRWWAPPAVHDNERLSLRNIF